MKIFVRTVLLVTALAVASACATTSFQSTWKAPDAQPVVLSGQKVVAFVLTKNAASRRAAEDALAREISAGGAQGIPSYTLVPDAAASDEAKAKAQSKRPGPRASSSCARWTSRKRSSPPPPTWVRATARTWGGYYGYGWGGAYGGGVDVRTNTIITVETLVYSIPQNKLIWAGQSNTTNPTKVDAFVKELATAARSEMKKAGLLK